MPAAIQSTDRADRQVMRLFLCGDVMTGRGIDQILAQPCDPVLFESYARSALDYVHLAEKAGGAIPRRVSPSYIWGTALDEFRRMQPDVRIINLETSVTRSQDYVAKGINYRMSPENADCLVAAGIDCCVLANNHVLDWGQSGLLDTLATLRRLDIRAAGAGRDLNEAAAPAVLDLAGQGRVLVFSYATATSGTPPSWAARPQRPGVNFLADLSAANAGRVAEQIAGARRPGDVVVVSIHWGPNWGYEIPEAQRQFAHALIDRTDVAIVHGHSSHHAKAIEIYRGRLILYGCGDFLNDYEGITGYEAYRDDLALMYFADVTTGNSQLAALDIVALQIRQFRLVRASTDDVDWVLQMLTRECRPSGTEFVARSDGRVTLSWPARAKQ